MKRVVNGLVVAAFAVGLVAGSLSLVPTWAQTVPITVVSGTVTANLSAVDNAVLDDIADGIAVTGSVTANLSATDNAVLDDIADGITVDLGVNNDVTVTSGTITANLGAIDNAVLDDIADGIAVTGTVTANLGATDNAVLDDIADGIAVTNAGTFAVQCSNCSGSGASGVDDAVFTLGTDSVAPAGFLADQATPDSVNEGDVGLARMTLARIQLNTLWDAAGNERGANVDASNRLTVVADLGATDNSVLDSIVALLTTIDADTSNQAAIAASLSVLDDTAGETADEYVTVRLTDGASFLSVASDGTIGSAIGTSGPLGAATYADFDGAALPTIANVDTEGELVPTSASIKGVQYMMLVSEDGSLQYGTATTPLVVGDGSGALNVIVDSGAITVSATNLDVQSGGADLATEATLGGVLTSANYAAAFGTAGSADTQVMSVQGIASMTPLSMYDTANTTGGADALSYISAGATEDEHAVKATPGTLFSITATNTNAAVRYLKCENDIAANTAPGTDTPELRIAIPGATTGAGFTTNFPKGWTFSTALTCWIVTGAADSDVAEVAANELIVFYTYK